MEEEPGRKMTSKRVNTSLLPEEEAKDDKKEKPYKIFVKDLFLFKENEMAAKKKEQLMNRSMKVHQKSTFSSRMKSRSHLGQLAFPSELGGKNSFEKFGLDPTLVLRLAEGSDTKRTVYEFIKDQRDRFMLEFSLSTKRNTIKRFERHMALKEKQLSKAEKKLQEDAMAFEEFLRENDQRSVDALKIAAQETINKLQMTAELKKVSMEVQAVKSEIAKTEFLLREYMKYGFFLLKLSPKQWQLQQALKKAQASKSKENLDIVLPRILKTRESSDDFQRASSSSEETVLSRGTEAKQNFRKSTFFLKNKNSGLSNRPESVSSEDSFEFLLDDDMDYDLEPEIYFKEPEELLQVFTELEEQNLTLVQYSQDVDENLEDVNKREKVIQDKVNGNIEFIVEQKELLRASCLREEEKAAELELRSRLFNFGEFNSDSQKENWGKDATWRSIYFAQKFTEILLTADAQRSMQSEKMNFLAVPKHVVKRLEYFYQQLKQHGGQEKLIDSLSRKINQVYRVCIGDAEVGSLNPVQKLVKVESRLVELSDLIESIPRENVEAIERIKQKERRQKMREEKLKEKQKHQEERLKAALERAVAQPKKKMGRRLIYRSKPSSANKQEILLVKDSRTKTEEEGYFFT